MTLSALALTAFAAASAAASASALSGGTLDLLDGSDTVLATVSLGSPTSSGPTTIMGGFPRSASGTAGTVASARYRTSANADWKTGMTVGLAGSGAQVVLSSLVIAAGQSVTVSSATLSHTAAAS